MNSENARVRVEQSDLDLFAYHAADIGIDAKTLFLQECERGWCRAVKESQDRARQEEERRRAMERAVYHENAELHRQMCREHPEGVGKGWAKGTRKINGRFVRGAS